jgi:predicted nuclease of predicted toxin-antitoxin system
MPAVRESATRSSRGRRVRIWIDAQLSPGLARWIRETFGIDAQAVRDVGLRNAKDPVIFKAAREARVVVMSKDEDFRSLVERLGPPPQVLWVTCGNTSNARLREILTKSLLPAMDLLRRGEPLVEISDEYVPPRGGKRLTRRSTRPRPRSGSGKRERPRSGRGE